MSTLTTTIRSASALRVIVLPCLWFFGHTTAIFIQKFQNATKRTTSTMCQRSAPSRPPSSASPGGPDSREFDRHLGLLCDVVRSGRWPAFETIALSNPRVFRIIWDAIPTASEGWATLLHAALRHDAPFKVVARMIALLPAPDREEALRSRDRKGRTPLHVAAACHADPRVLKMLGSALPSACTTKDKDARTPLHLVCDASCAMKQQERNAPSYDAVKALLSESLAASILEDEDGANALECAILSEASCDVVTLLQKATMEASQERERRRSGGEKRRVSMDDGRVDSPRACLMFSTKRRRGARIHVCVEEATGHRRPRRCHSYQSVSQFVDDPK